MPIDFSVLSMTELRNRPGEVLDRVADHGEAFIIERGGHRKACLVPLYVFMPDVAPARIAEEIGELAEHEEKPRAVFTDGRELAFRFSEELENKTVIELEIVLPHGYPNTCPRVYASPITDNPPHRWADGALCLYGVVSGWNPGKHSTFFTLQLARQWIRRYDAWRKSGTWPTIERMAHE